MRLFADPVVAVAEPMLARAYALAERGRGSTAPNPMVGCVVVRDGSVVGEGYHERAGGPHAEAAALAAAGERARGATAYVTLEPCNHHGRTAPCADALIRAGVDEVVVGMADPNPDVAGGGAEALRRAGVRVRFVEDPAPFEQLNEAWLKHLDTGLPWLDVKVALTLDGRPALAPDSRAAISGPEAAQRVTMRLRAAADAVAVGAATQSADDPLLTVRDAAGLPADVQPLRVVICRTGCPRPGARVLDPSLGPSLVLIPEERRDELEAMHAAGVDHDTYVLADGLAGALRTLARRGADRVLLEAGPGMFTAAWQADAIDRLVLVHAGGVAGAAAPSLYLGAPDGADGVLEARMECVESGIAGGDAVTVWERRAAGRPRPE